MLAPPLLSGLIFFRTVQNLVSYRMVLYLIFFQIKKRVQTRGSHLAVYFHFMCGDFGENDKK